MTGVSGSASERTQRRAGGLILMGLAATLVCLRVMVLAVFAVTLAGAVTPLNAQFAQGGLEDGAALPLGGLIVLRLAVAVLITGAAAAYAGLAPRLRKGVLWAKRGIFLYFGIMMAVWVLSETLLLPEAVLFGYGDIRDEMLRALAARGGPLGALVYAMALLDMFFAIYALVMLSDRPRSAPLDDIDRQRARKKEIPS